MAAANFSLVGRVAHIYDANGQFLLKTEVTWYDGKTREIEIAGYPEFRKGDSCKVVVETFPFPSKYMGRVTSIAGTPPFSIALYNEKRQTSEIRKNERYKVSAPVIIESCIENGRAYTLHTPLEAKLVDISKSGARICVAGDTMQIGSLFEMMLEIGGKREHIIAEVVNFHRLDAWNVEYGCSFYAKGEEIKKRK